MSQSSNESTTDQERPVDLSESDRHWLLADECRRMTLDLLDNRTTPVTLEELARGIAAREDGSVTVESEPVKRAIIALHHNHLPMMADMGIIDYDPTSKRIESLQGASDLLTP